MNYAEFINEARNLKNPWPPQESATAPHPALTHDPLRVDSEREKLADVRSFIPTAFPGVNALVAKLKPRIAYDMPANDSPYYTESDDALHLPPPAAFLSSELYARTLLHELSHWTKGGGRVPRGEPTDYELFLWHFFGMPPWLRATEEFTAELTANALIEKFAPELIPVGAEYGQHYIHGWADNMERVAQMPPDAVENLLQKATEQAKNAFEFILSEMES